MILSGIKARNSSSVLALSIILLATACSPAQPLNFSVQDVTPSSTTIDANLVDITVTPASPTERTGALPPAVANVTETWKTATQEALTRAAVFNDEAKTRVNLEVKILKFDAPSMGITFPTFSDARYTLIDRKTGAATFSKVISGEGSTPMSFAFVGIIRARESVNRSAQSNISNFISDLEHSSIAQPKNGKPSS